MSESAFVIADHLIAVREMRLHVRSWLPMSSTVAAHPPVLLIHGLASAAAIWDLVAPRLAEKGRQVYALDQRGHGESDKPATGYDFATIVADDRAVIDALALPQAIVVGHSWGGAVALNLAATYPDRVAALVLVDGGFMELARRAWTHDQAIAALTPPRFTGTPVAAFLDRVKTGPLGPHWNAQLQDIMLRIVQVQSDGTIAPRLAFENHMQIVEALWQHPTFAQYAHLRCPVLLIAPEQDSANEFAQQKHAAIAELAAAHSNVRGVVVPDTIHDMPLQRPERLAELILADGPS